MSLRMFDSEVACEIGVNGAVVLNQLHYWISRGYGKKLDGVVYIYNSFEKWHEQFPFMSIRTLKRVFKQLVESELVFSFKKGYDRTSRFALNYSHPIVTKWLNPSCQNVTMESDKMARCNIHTRTTAKDNAKGIHRKPSEVTKPKPTTATGNKVFILEDEREKKSYRRNYQEAKNWLENQSGDFQNAVAEYADYHMNSPKVSHPHAYRMSIIVEIWKKHIGKPNHTDFTYINKEDLKPVENNSVEVLEDEVFGFDQEMQMLYERGEML